MAETQLVPTRMAGLVIGVLGGGVGLGGGWGGGQGKLGYWGIAA